MRRSDATLQKIYRTINALDWVKLQEIKMRIEAGGKRDWTVNPPWNE